MQPKATPTPTPKLAPAKKSPNKKAKVPSFIPKTDYPVYKAEIIASNETAGSGSKILGVPGEALDRNAARPLYHPAVVSQRHSDYPWLDVRFELRADASFEVYLISSTGDPVFDQIALQTLRSWKWKPKTVRGRPVASTELVRLTKH